MNSVKAEDFKNVVPANTTLSQRNIFNNIAALITSALNELTGNCVYGRNCGGGCSTYNTKKNHLSYKKIIDDLDDRCYEHDRCLFVKRSSFSRWGCTKLPGMDPGKCHCYCDGLLSNQARDIYNGGKCPWWKFWCRNSTRVQAVYAIHKAMSQKYYCGNC